MCLCMMREWRGRFPAYILREWAPKMGFCGIWTWYHVNKDGTQYRVSRQCMRACLVGVRDEALDDVLAELQVGNLPILVLKTRSRKP